MMTLHDTIQEPMTTEEAARIAVLLFHEHRGRISDDGNPPRPWLYLNLPTEEEARQLFEVFGRRGFAKAHIYGGRYGAWGNEALEIFEYLLDAGLSGRRREVVLRLLQKHGDDGRP